MAAKWFNSLDTNSNLNEYLDRVRTTSWINFIKDYCSPLEINTFGPNLLKFSCIVPYQPFWKIAKMALFYTCMKFEATEALKTTKVLEVNKVMARITLFCCFWKKTWIEWWNIQDWGCGGHGCYFQLNSTVISQTSISSKCTDTVLWLKSAFLIA